MSSLCFQSDIILISVYLQPVFLHLWIVLIPVVDVLIAGVWSYTMKYNPWSFQIFVLEFAFLSLLKIATEIPVSKFIINYSHLPFLLLFPPFKK